jgi:tetratricopeptide (TPR) repeat protein
VLSVEHFSNLINKNFNNPTVLVDLGSSVLEEKEASKAHYDWALRALEQAISLVPRSVPAIFTRARLKTNLGLTSGALRDFNTVIQMKPEVHAAWFRRGMLYFQMKDYKSAVMDFVQTVTLAPDFTDAYLLRGYAMMNLGGYAEAAQDFNYVIGAKSERSGEALYHRSKCFYNLRNIDLAIKDCDNLLQIGWVTTEIYGMRAMCYLVLREFDKAIADYDLALTLDPDNADILHNKNETLRAKADAIVETPVDTPIEGAANEMETKKEEVVEPKPKKKAAPKKKKDE